MRLEVLELVAGGPCDAAGYWYSEGDGAVLGLFADHPWGEGYLRQEDRRQELLAELSAPGARFAEQSAAWPRTVPVQVSFLARTPEDALRSVVLHEVGHHRLWQAWGEAPGHREFLHESTALLPEGLPPSLYGATGGGEWFAEGYAAWRTGLAPASPTLVAVLASLA